MSPLISSTVGILQSTLLPSLGFHTLLSTPAYLLARQTNLVGTKDILWSSAQALNVLYAAIGSRLALGVPLSTVLQSVPKSGWLIIAGVGIWGGRLTWMIVARMARNGWEDDKRYEWVKESPRGWKEAIGLFAGEAVVQSLITLPVTALFRTVYPGYGGGLVRGWEGWIEAAAIGLWGVGMGLEVLADWQLQRYKRNGGEGVLQEGVWSIVRHPNYLGDILIHLSYPLLLLSSTTTTSPSPSSPTSTLFHPALLLGPLTNYLFLRHIGGDKENESAQLHRYAMTDPGKVAIYGSYRERKNAVWPKAREFLGNGWVWGVLGLGGAVLGCVRGVEWAVGRWSLGGL